MSAVYSLRRAGADLRDAQTIAEHRTQMFVDMGAVSAESISALRDASIAWVQPLLVSGE